MKLSDIMSAAGLHGYAEVALVLFMLAFVMIAARVFSPSQARSMEQARRLVLEDEYSDDLPTDTTRGPTAARAREER